jgi:hypothetical protein
MKNTLKEFYLSILLRFGEVGGALSVLKILLFSALLSSILSIFF